MKLSFRAAPIAFAFALFLVSGCSYLYGILFEEQQQQVVENPAASRSFAGSVNSGEKKEFVTTIVSAYYPIDSKHPQSNYVVWMTNFLQIENGMVIFTDSSETAKLLEDLRPMHLRSITTICVFPLKSLSAFANYGEEVWKEQMKYDREIIKHKSYLLYLIWLGKAEFVLKAAKMNPFNSEYFLWNDIGSFRSSDTITRYVKGWPDANKVRLFCSAGVAMQLVNKDMLQQFCNLGEITTAEQFKTDRRYNLEMALSEHGNGLSIGGAQQCGTQKAFEQYFAYFNHILDIMIKSKTFAGKDQTVMATVALWRPNAVSLIFRGRTWFIFDDLLHANSTKVAKVLACPS